MNNDATAHFGAAGTLFAFAFANVNHAVGALAGLVTVGYVLTKWVFLFRDRRRARARSHR